MSLNYSIEKIDYLKTSVIPRLNNEIISNLKETINEYKGKYFNEPIAFVLDEISRFVRGGGKD